MVEVLLVFFSEVLLNLIMSKNESYFNYCMSRLKASHRMEIPGRKV